jgi:hypothetical protein
MPAENDPAAIVVAAARQILQFVEGMDFDGFRGDSKPPRPSSCSS